MSVVTPYIILILFYEFGFAMSSSKYSRFYFRSTHSGHLNHAHNHITPPSFFPILTFRCSHNCTVLASSHKSIGFVSMTTTSSITHITPTRNLIGCLEKRNNDKTNFFFSRSQTFSTHSQISVRQQTSLEKNGVTHPNCVISRIGAS